MGVNSFKMMMVYKKRGIISRDDRTAKVMEQVADNGGVNVTYMSDNIRDTWQPYGKADMLQLALFVARLGSWRTKEELDHLLEMGSMVAARAIGLAEDHGVGVGKRADLVIFEAKSGHEAIITQARKLWVIKNGRAVARNGELLVRSGYELPAEQVRKVLRPGRVDLLTKQTGGSAPNWVSALRDPANKGTFFAVGCWA